MKQYFLATLLFVNTAAIAGSIEVSVGTGLNATFKTKSFRAEGDKTNYSLGYEHKFADHVTTVFSVGNSYFAGLDDKSLRIAPRLVYGNLFATAGLAYHRLDKDSAYAGLLGVGFRTTTEPGKFGYGMNVIQEQGFGKKTFNQLDVSLVGTYSL